MDGWIDGPFLFDVRIWISLFLFLFYYYYHYGAYVIYLV